MTLQTSSGEDYWLTRVEVAERLKVPEKTLAQWASQRKGPPYRRFGRHTRYRLSDCISWENAQQPGGTTTGDSAFTDSPGGSAA